MIFYINCEFKVFTVNTGGLTQVENDFFDDKCKEFVEGYLFIPAGTQWPPESGKTTPGDILAPWQDWNELETAQREYEREQLAALKAQNADMAAALEVLGVSE